MKHLIIVFSAVFIILLPTFAYAQFFVFPMPHKTNSYVVRTTTSFQTFPTGKIYQRATEFFLHGDWIQEKEKLYDIVEVDFDKESDTQSHSTIDEASLPYIIDFISKHIIGKNK